MNESAVHAVMIEARNCALVMLENATYIQGELANVRMNDALRAQTEQVCTALVGTKLDFCPFQRPRKGRFCGFFGNSRGFWKPMVQQVMSQKDSIPWFSCIFCIFGSKKGKSRAKHDIISELFELDELLGSEASASVIRSRVDRIVRWIKDDITRMHQLVMALESASKQDPACGSACVLVAESATNILNAFNRTRAAADSLRAEADETRNA